MSGRASLNTGIFYHYPNTLKALQLLPISFVTFAYKCGWRLSEIANLIWDQVDLNQGIVTLNPGETKNAEGRTVYLDDELREVFQRQWKARKQAKKIRPYSFPQRR